MIEHDRAGEYEKNIDGCNRPKNTLDLFLTNCSRDSVILLSVTTVVQFLLYLILVDAKHTYTGYLFATASGDY